MVKFDTGHPQTRQNLRILPWPVWRRTVLQPWALLPILGEYDCFSNEFFFNSTTKPKPSSKTCRKRNSKLWWGCWGRHARIDHGSEIRDSGSRQRLFDYSRGSSALLYKIFILNKHNSISITIFKIKYYSIKNITAFSRCWKFHLCF